MHPTSLPHHLMTSSPFQPAQQVDVGGLEVAVNHDDDAQPHRDFGRSHGHDEKHKNLPVGVGPVGGKGRQQDVYSIEHQLYAHENNDGVAPNQHARHPNGEQSRGEKDVVLQRNGADDFGNGLRNGWVHAERPAKRHGSRPVGKGTLKMQA